MSDRSPNDDRVVNIDQQSSVTTPTKSKTTDVYENRSLGDMNSFPIYHDNGTNGQDYHSNNGTNMDEHHNGTNNINDNGLKQISINNDYFPVNINEHENGR
jgi:hypothetical protein